MRRIVARVSLAALLPLTGCASLAPMAPTGPGEPTMQRQAARAYSEVIDIGGRLSVHYQANGRDEALHGSFTWNQTPAHTTVTLLSPLGQTVAVIDVTPDGARLAQGGQPARSASDVDTLTAQTLGWPLPIAGLRDWLQGFITKSDGSRFVATPQTREVTSRDGWDIVYDNWLEETSPAPSPITRPKRIDLSRSTAQAGDVAIRIVIDSWQAR